MQSSKISNLLVPSRMGFLSTRPKSLYSLIVGKINKFVKGSETPYKYHDFVREQMIKEDKYRETFLCLAKALYLRDKARVRIVKHNARVRTLEDKVLKNGVIGMKSFTNRF